MHFQNLRHDAVRLKFDGTIYAELIVAAELIVQDPRNIRIGISRPPCYVCCQVLKLVAERLKQGGRQLMCQPAYSSGLIWPVDLPNELPLPILSETLKELSKGAAQTFNEHRPIIEDLAKEAKTHAVHIRKSSFSSSCSDETVDELETLSGVLRAAEKTTEDNLERLEYFKEWKEQQETFREDEGPNVHGVRNTSTIWQNTKIKNTTGLRRS